MTGERRQDLILITLVLSITAHVALMAYVRPRVMTHVTTGSSRTPRRASQVLRQDVRPRPVRIDVVRDVAAKKDVPKAEAGLSMPVAGLEDPSDRPPAPPVASTSEKPELPTDLQPTAEPLATFDVKKFKLVEGPKEAPARMVSSSRPVPLPTAPVKDSAVTDLAPVAVAVPAPSVRIPELIPELDLAPPEPEKVIVAEPEPEKSGKEAFTPGDEVFARVDEKIVEREKAAVRGLLDVSRAVDLSTAVALSSAVFTTNGWTHFRVTISAAKDLPVVPKDVVVLMDASGSIGGDRLNSCRKAARQILRTITNTGDRFNFVAFRDRFTYAFKTWQSCTAASFKASDAWLNTLVAHGRTDVFATISSVLTLPRDPARPLIAMVVTDGEANAGVSDTAEILSRFTRLNDGLISVYIYGVKQAANRELIDVLTRGNRGEGMIFDGWRWSAGSELEKFAMRFRDPLLSDLRIVFTSASHAEILPQRLKNLYRGETVEVLGRVPASSEMIAFSLRGLNGATPYEGFFRIPVKAAPVESALFARWRREQAIDAKLH